MGSHIARGLGQVRFRSLRGLLVVIAWLAAFPAAAHEGHNHGEAPAASAAPTSPRVALHSNIYELVAVLKGDELTIYLDRFADNAPVTDAKIAVTIGDQETVAQSSEDGTYIVKSPQLREQGPVELVFSITARSGDDLLLGELRRTGEPHKPHAEPPASLQQRALDVLARLRELSLPRVNPSPEYSMIVPGAALALGFALGLVARARRRAVPVVALVLLTVLLSVSLVRAHEGRDHGSEAKMAAPAGHTPQCLPDGTVFVPRPSQRLLEVRTTVTKLNKAERAVTLISRATADPNGGGVAQSLNGGRVIAPEKGLPRVSQAVRRGEVLAQIEPALPQADRTIGRQLTPAESF